MRNWTKIKDYTDILFDFYNGIARITINRPEVYNAFRPQTNAEMLDAMDYCRRTPAVRVVVLTGAGDKAFCSGGDQHYKSRGGYRDEDGTPRLNVLELHKAIRSIPKPVIAMVNGYSIGGGNVLNVVCDLSIASSTARFGQTSGMMHSGGLVLRLAVSMPASDRPIWHVAWARKRPARFGSCAANTQPTRLWRWAW